MGRPKKEELAKKVEEKVKAKPAKEAKAEKVEAKPAKAPKEDKVKELKKATPKEAKDAGKKEKKKVVAGSVIMKGVPAAEYRKLSDPRAHALFSTMTGTPGWVKGKIYEFAAESDVGKSGLATYVLGLFQASGEQVGMVDAEGAADRIFQKKIGLNSDDIFYTQPFCGEDAFADVRTLFNDKGVKVAVLDSIGHCTPRAMATDASNAMGALARLTSVEMPKVSKAVQSNKGNLIVISQIKKQPGVMGDSRYVTGGSGVMFASRVRWWLNAVETLRDEKTKQITGYTIRMVVKKNHTGPKRSTPFDIKLNQLFQIKWDETALAWAKQFKLVDKEKKVIKLKDGKVIELTKTFDADLTEACQGREAEIFWAVNDIFERMEDGQSVDYEASEDDLEGESKGGDEGEEEADDDDLGSL